MVCKSGGRLLIPFILWSVIYTVKNAVFDFSSPKELIIAFFIGKSATPLYYILVLLQLTACTLFIAKKRNKWMYFITPIYLLFLYLYNITSGKLPAGYETLFPAWFIFYLLGMDAREGKFDNCSVNMKVIAVALIASIGEAILLLKLGCSIGFASSQIKFSSFTYSALLAIWLVQNKKDIKPNILSVVGDCSFGIYFFHIIVIWVVGKLLSILEVDMWWERWITTFALTACISLGFVRITRKMFEDKKILKYIGFE